MTPDREALARLIDPAHENVPEWPPLLIHYAAADRVIAAGWTPPVVVTETPSEAQQGPLSPVDAQQGPADPLAAKLARAVEATKNMTPDERAAMWREQKASFVRAEMGFGSDADEAKYAAALASGDPYRIAECKAEEADRMAYAEAAMEASGQKPRGGAARADIPSPVTDEMVDAETPHPEIVAAIQAEAFERAARLIERHTVVYGAVTEMGTRGDGDRSGLPYAEAIRALSPLPAGSRVVVIPAEKDARASLEFDLQVKVSLAMKPHIPTVPRRLRHDLAEAAVSAVLSALTEGEKP